MQSAHAAGLLLFVAIVSHAQTPPAAPNLIRNGGFESTLQSPNLWAGVDKDGFLAGFHGYLPVLADSGNIADAPMPTSVAVADLNSDGLPDILTADPLGYVRSYLNTGSKEAPKFTSGLLSTPFLARADGTAAPIPGSTGEQAVEDRLRIHRNEMWSERRQGVRLSLATLGGGKLAMVAGNYFGDIFFIPAVGSGAQLAFPQPEPIEKAMISPSSPDNRRWGNVFAPLLNDWDGDGKADLLVGEGSYSANNVHFFPNDGSETAPAFSLANRRFLALGEGRQQLTPAIADADGDGKADLLVSDSSGKISVYLRPASWKKGDRLAFSGYLSKSGGLTKDDNQAAVIGTGIHTIATGDLNGDGLFDIVAGKPGPGNRVAWAPNKGSKEQPKFEQWSDIAGEKPVPAAWMLPSQWEVDTGETRGNFFAYANAVSSQEDAAVDAKEGTRAVKFGYANAAGSPLASMTVPGDRSFRFADYEQESHFYDMTLPERLVGAPNRVFMIEQKDVTLEVGKPYVLSFQHKGNGVAKANVFLGWWGFKALGSDTVTRGSRGAVQVKYNHANEHGKVSKDFRPAAAWTAFEEKFTVNFKDKNLKDEKTTHKATFIIVFELTSPGGFLYLDDLKISPAA